MLKRDYAIDFLRGFAALWIVLIHTVCKSGASYVPSKILDYALIIDVPLFIFISGMSFTYQKSVDKVLTSLKKIYKFWLKLLLLYWLYVLIFNHNYFTVENIINSFFFKLDSKAGFYALKESMWFMPMYFIVSLISSLIISKSEKSNIDIKKVLFIIFTIYGMQLYYIKIKIPFLTEVLLYTFIYILGYYFYNNKISLKRKIFYLIFIIILNILIFKLPGGVEVAKISKYKFEFNIIYLVYSMISIFGVLIIYDLLKIKSKNILCIIGQNAILCYFAQGISSSLMNYIIKLYNFRWYIKLPISIIINIIICLLITIILYYIFKLMDIFTTKLNLKG